MKRNLLTIQKVNSARMLLLGNYKIWKEALGILYIVLSNSDRGNKTIINEKQTNK